MHSDVVMVASPAGDRSAKAGSSGASAVCVRHRTILAFLAKAYLLPESPDILLSDFVPDKQALSRIEAGGG
jgi:hypothetical protein